MHRDLRLKKNIMIKCRLHHAQPRGVPKVNDYLKDSTIGIMDAIIC